MSTPTGHAAFHLQHLAHGDQGTRGDLVRLLRESMRHLRSSDVAFCAAANPSIVAADSFLNAGFINDGGGGFREVADVAEVVEYGDERVGRVRRKLKSEQKTVSTFVVHLPKTMCREIPDYYPRLDKDGRERLDPVTGEPMSRSRLVARDRDEAMRYFRDAIEYLGDNVIPGGQEAIHGWATNFDESTPHIQLMADPFAPDPKAPASNPDALRTEFSQAYGNHRDVRGGDGKQIPGPEKMREYQTRMRERMVSLGYPVQADVGPDHGIGRAKEAYGEVMDAKAAAEAALAGVTARTAANNEKVAEFNARAVGVRDEFAARETKLDERECLLDQLEAEIPRLRQSALAEGRKEGRAAAEDDRRKLEAERSRLEEARRRLQALADQRPHLPTHDELLATDSNRIARWARAQRLPDGTTLYDRYEELARIEHGRRSGWRADGKRVATPYDEWLAEVEKETVGEAYQRHQRTINGIQSGSSSQFGPDRAGNETEYS